MQQPARQSAPSTHPPRPAASPSPRATLGREVHRQLRELLVTGVLSPGEKLSLRTIAARLGVSVQPVREAVSRLVADRALEVLPNRAVRVPVLTRPQFRELTVIRLAIEGFAVQQAAETRTTVDLKAIRTAARVFRRERARTTPDLAVAVASNQALHFAVYRAAGLPELLPIIEGLWLRIGPVLNLDMRSNVARVRIGRAHRCHEDLVAAIAQRDSRAARAALTADIGEAARYIESCGVLPEGINGTGR
ncbi:MAG: GntR family transcriptional regulator [Casimicrobiaceae bacterium]